MELIPTQEKESLPTPPVNMKECIDVCQECYRTCMQTIPHCLAEGGRHAEVKHIRLLMECADACNLSARFMMIGSEMHHLTCTLCADICDRCATECESFPNDVFMQRCAELCRKCADACRYMAKSH